MICASGSAVEHLLAKEGVAGSIPVSRFQNKKGYPLGYPFLFSSEVLGSKFDVYAPLRSVQSRGPPDLVHRLALSKPKGCPSGFVEEDL